MQLQNVKICTEKKCTAHGNVYGIHHTLKCEVKQIFEEHSFGLRGNLQFKKL